MLSAFCAHNRYRLHAPHAINPNVSRSLQQTTQSTFDFFTGKVTSQSDANENVTNTNYVNQLLGTVDPYGRPGITTSPLGGARLIATRGAAKLGNKLDFIFGKAAGNAHNINRSQSMAVELAKIGIRDTPAYRKYVAEHLIKVASQPGVLQANGRIARESLLWGPGGAVKLQSIWSTADDLITVIIHAPK